MACATDWGVLLSKYADGECTPEERQQADSHLPGCATCTNTLALFRQNEKVLESSLAGEAFGDLVVDEVMAEIRRLETPPVLAPEVRGGSWKSALRRWLPTAAAASAVVALAGIALAARSEFANVSETLTQLQQKNDKLVDIIVANGKEEQGPKAAGLKPAQIIRPKFAASEKLVVYEILRSHDDGATWTTLAKDLKDPYFEDRSATGTSYDYRCIGRRADGSSVESTLIRVRLPAAGLDPQTSMRVTFVAVTTDSKTATFEVRRYIDGQERRLLCQVHAGDALGADDFATGFTFESVTTQDEVLDLGARSLTRPNKLAHLRSPSKLVLSIWRYDSELVPMPGQ